MKKLLFCTNKLNRSNIKRESRDGVEHIILTSYTLPAGIVMNSVLYTAEEIDKSYLSLNRTPVTIEHPEIDGVYVSANDPEIDFEYRFGAFNDNARKTKDGRIALDKVINVQKALKLEKGRRLLDRIEEVETNEDARPIHTSVGVYLDVDVLENPVIQVNGPSKGEEYTSIAKGMVFDHDAILIDSVGASTPEQGTGIGVNKEKLPVSHYIMNELSFSDISDRLHQALRERYKGVEDAPYSYIQHDSIKSDTFVYEENNILYLSEYSIDENENVSIQDSRVEVKLKRDYEPVIKTENNENEDEEMREKIILLLSGIGISVNAEDSDEKILKVFKDHTESLKKPKAKPVDEKEIKTNSDLIETVKNQNVEIEGLKTTLQANADKVIDDKIKSISVCAKFKGIPESALKAMAISDPIDFDKMHVDSIPSASIGHSGFQVNEDGIDDNIFAINVAGDAK